VILHAVLTTSDGSKETILFPVEKHIRCPKLVIDRNYSFCALL